MDARVKPGHDAERTISNQKQPRVRSAKTLRRFRRANIRFTFQTAGEQNAKAPPPLFSQGAGCAGISHPLAHEGKCSLTKREGAERRKARVTFQRLAAHAQ